jgi:hypothetical protein
MFLLVARLSISYGSPDTGRLATQRCLGRSTELLQLSQLLSREADD